MGAHPNSCICQSGSTGQGGAAAARLACSATTPGLEGPEAPGHRSQAPVEQNIMKSGRMSPLNRNRPQAHVSHTYTSKSQHVIKALTAAVLQLSCMSSAWLRSTPYRSLDFSISHAWRGATLMGLGGALGVGGLTPGGGRGGGGGIQ